MARVVFSSGQHRIGATDVIMRRFDAERALQLIQDQQIAGRLDHAAVAIDGDIHNDARFLSLESTSEVHFMGQVAGGR